MEVRVKTLGGLEFEAEARGHRVVTSAPKGVGGRDDAMMPTELLMASLGTCAGYYAAQYLRRQQLSAEGLEVRVEADVLKNPGRMANFTVEVIAPGASPEDHEGLMEAVGHCTVHNTLSRPQWIGLEVQTGKKREHAMAG